MRGRGIEKQVKLHKKQLAKSRMQEILQEKWPYDFHKWMVWQSGWRGIVDSKRVKKATATNFFNLQPFATVTFPMKTLFSKVT